MKHKCSQTCFEKNTVLNYGQLKGKFRVIDAKNWYVTAWGLPSEIGASNST